MKKSALKLTIVLAVYIFGNLFFTGSILASQVYYVHSDHLGSTAVITNESGEAVQSDYYYPFGSSRPSLSDDSLPTTHNSQPPITEHQYTSQISDEDQTGLYYYNARYYNPQIAKFTQADTRKDGLNGYAYVSNNPINFTDPTGNMMWPGEGGGGSGSDSASSSDGNGGESQDLLVMKKPPKLKLDLVDKKSMTDLERKETEWYNNLLFDFWWWIVGTSGAELTREEVINSLSAYLYLEIPYSPEFLVIWDLRDKINEIAPNPQMALAVLSKLHDREASLWETKFSSTLYEEYQNGLFVCYNFADLFSILLQQIDPDIPVFAGGMTNHALDFVILKGEMYTVDPTWNRGLTPLNIDMIEDRPFLDWKSAGVNPLLSNKSATYFSSLYSVPWFMQNELMQKIFLHLKYN